MAIPNIPLTPQQNQNIHKYFPVRLKSTGEIIALDDQKKFNGSLHERYPNPKEAKAMEEAQKAAEAQAIEDAKADSEFQKQKRKDQLQEAIEAGKRAQAELAAAETEITRSNPTTPDDEEDAPTGGPAKLENGPDQKGKTFEKTPENEAKYLELKAAKAWMNPSTKDEYYALKELYGTK